MNTNGRPKMDLKRRFLSKVDISPGENGCWLWTGYVNPSGYGELFFGKRGQMAHRASYSLFVGEISPGWHIHHRCENKACVRPEHLVALCPSDHARQTDGFRDAREQRKKRTRCAKGHPYEGVNLEVDERGCRVCVACKSERDRIAIQARADRNKMHPGPGKGIQWALKTHCPKGHPYEGVNLKIRADGARVCRTCYNEVERLRLQKRRAENPEYGRPSPWAGKGTGAHWRAKTHCPQGHEYTAENTKVNKSGSRSCRTCAREYYRNKTGAQPRTLKEVCLRGHPFAGENLRINRDGSRACRACLRENAKLAARRKREKQS